MATDDRMNRILQQYHQADDDYGFSAVSEEDYKKQITKAAEDAEDYVTDIVSKEYKERLEQVEKIIIPFLTKLHSSGDKEYIYWPNRTDAINKQIDKLLKLTRG